MGYQSDKFCTYCGGLDHTVGNCKRSRVVAPSTVLFCQCCGGNHKFKNCPKRKLTGYIND